MNISVRAAVPEDAEGIVSVLVPIIETGLYTAIDTAPTVEFERNYIQDFPAAGIFHVAEDLESGALVGFQNVEPFADYTHAFDHVGVIATFVALDRRRQGIGKALFTATFEAARHKGYEKFFTYIRADNPAALNCYLKHGFHRVGIAEKHAKFGERYVDEIIIERFL